MSWLTLSVNTDAGTAEALSEALLENGALSVDILDADADTPDEQAIFGEPGEPTAAAWQHNRVNALFPADADVVEVLEACCMSLGISPLPPHQVTPLEENDWVRLTQSQFDPIRISDRLWIVPTWHEAADPEAVNIVLDPGLAFGTGSHPTTRLCLRWLDSHLGAGEGVLDYGCGSGILAIAAKKLGAGKVVGVDVDPQAVQSSRDNAAANQVEAEFFLPDEAPTLQCDVVVANILTNPLKALAPLLAAAVRPGGRLVLSGVLAEQADEVMAVYGQWIDFDAPVIEEGWSCLSGVKKAAGAAVTQCPECGTRFKVTEEQMQAHQGMVRCGRCRAVFNANPAADHSAGHDEKAGLEIETEETSQPAVELSAAPPLPLIEHGEQQLEGAASEPQQAELLPVQDRDIPSTGQAAAQDNPLQLEALSEIVRDDAPGFSEPLNLDDAATDPGHQPAEKPQPAQPLRWPWLLASVLLLIALLAQAMYFFRVDLAARLPGLKPGLQAYCGLLNCTVPLPADAEQMAIESSDLVADAAQASIITVNVLLYNRAPFAQAYPNLELTLTDLDDKEIARRVFKPVEYLKDRSSLEAGAPASREFSVQLRLDTADLKPSGYRLFLFYPH